MAFPRLTKRRWALLAVLLALYLLGYVWVRLQGVLIHRVSFEQANHGIRYDHTVTTGDFGPGIGMSWKTRFVVFTSYEIFTPLRWGEALAWHSIAREYTF